MEYKSLAYEILEENKKTNKRVFIIALIEAVIIIGMFVGFLIYESQFDYVSSIEQTQENIETSTVSQNID